MYMAIDQYGRTYHGLEHPRKDLMERLCRSSAKKMYRDIGGKVYHVGYVIGGLWLELFKVQPYQNEEKQK